MSAQLHRGSVQCFFFLIRVIHEQIDVHINLFFKKIDSLTKHSTVMPVNKVSYYSMTNFFSIYALRKVKYLYEGSV